MTVPLPSSGPPRAKPKSRGDRNARRVEIAGQTTAGSVGSAFGAAKLRDAVKEEHPRKFDRAVLRGTNRAIKMGARPEAITRAVRTVQAGKPHVGALLIATGAGGLAAGAHHYQQIHDWTRKRQAQVGALAKSEPRHTGRPVRLRVTPPPRHAARPYVGRRRKLSLADKVRAQTVLHSKQIGRVVEGGAELFKAACCTGEMTGVPRSAWLQGIGKVRVVGYHGEGKFHVIDPRDQGRIVHRDRLKFHKKGNGMSKSAFDTEMAKGAGGDAQAAADAVKQLKRFKPKPSVKPTGPGSMRSRMSQSAWESQGAATRRPVSKSAFGVELAKAHPLRDAAAIGGAAGAGALLAKPSLAKPLGQGVKAVVQPVKKLLKPGPVAKSGVPQELAKASAFGTSGDKRNTKYYLATAAGGGAAAQAGARLGARAGGSTARQVRQASGTDLAGQITRGAEGAGKAMAGPKHAAKPPGMLRTQADVHRSITRGAIGDIKAVKGGKAMLRGGRVGSAVGIAGAAGAYHAHRKRVGLAKSAFGVEIAKADTKKRKPPSGGRVAAGTAFGSFHAAAAGKKGKKLRAVGSSLGHSIAGSAAGSTVATLATRGKSPAAASFGGTAGGYAGAARSVYTNQAKGRFKRES